MAREDPRRKEFSNQAKRNYQNKLKQAKSAHWRFFLEKAKKKDIWTAHQFTAKRLGTLIPGGTEYSSASRLTYAIRQYFFPPYSNPVDTSLPKDVELEHKELADTVKVTIALLKSSNTLSPGADQVPYGMWKGIHRTQLLAIPTMLKDLFRWSIHPPALKDALGILLPKPAKEDYDAFSSHRVIALIQTFSKMAQRIINQRLIKFSRTNGLYSIRQTGSLPQRAILDAGIALKH